MGEGLDNGSRGGGGGEIGQELNLLSSTSLLLPFRAPHFLVQNLLWLKFYLAPRSSTTHSPFLFRLGLEMGKHQKCWATKVPSLGVGPEA